jgi:DNA-binding transcriptional MerR regulator
VDNYLKIGELANMTGVTIRTLHYYDEVDLLKPVEITETGHRLYDLKSITELYRIISMKISHVGKKTADTDIEKILDTIAKTTKFSKLLESEIVNNRIEVYLL